MSHCRRLGLSLLVAFAASCARAETRKLDRSEGPLPPGIVASVGEQLIPAPSVGRIARDQGLAPPAALDVAISDALLGEHVPQKRVLLERVASARALLDAFHQEAVGVGVPSSEEMDRARESRWWELDRPEMRRVVHVVVVFEEGTDRDAARRHAEKIYERAKNAINGVQFREYVKSVPNESFTVKLEDLLPVAADGRALEVLRYNPPGTASQQYHMEFAKPVFELGAVDQVTPLFESPSGFHVAMLLQIIPPKRLSSDELRAELARDIYAARARGIAQQDLEQALATVKPEHTTDAQELMALVSMPVGAGAAPSLGASPPGAP